MHADNNYRRSGGHDPRPARLRLPCPCVRQGHGSPGPRRHQRTRPGRLRSEVARTRPHPRLGAGLLPALRPRGCRYRARKFTNATRGRSTTVSAMTPPDADAAARFLALHRPGRPLLLPNPWDVGSARILASLGFEALATTSSGYAATLGRPDGSVTREEAIGHAAAIVAAPPLPVSARLEDRFGAEPAALATPLPPALQAGLAGCSIPLLPHPAA